MADGEGSGEPRGVPESAARFAHNRAPGGQNGNANARTHGMRSLKRTVRELGSRTIDKRTSVGRALAAWRADLIEDHGGADALSTAEIALIDEAVVTKLLLGSVNAWLLERGEKLVNKRRGALVQAVRDRSALVRELRETLMALGLKRSPDERDPLREHLERTYRKRAGSPRDGPDPQTDPDEPAEP